MLVLRKNNAPNDVTIPTKVLGFCNRIRKRIRAIVWFLASNISFIVGLHEIRVSVIG